MTYHKYSFKPSYFSSSTPLIEFSLIILNGERRDPNFRKKNGSEIKYTFCDWIYTKIMQAQGGMYRVQGCLFLLISQMNSLTNFPAYASFLISVAREVEAISLSHI